ncbi:MAG: dTDP-glucose 4,6-dehydratase [Clostridia bacterium]|jgi:dTDP-glucose 4,6-dehydratase|nr:dTDP-glucose 4,6-dehydratase [Clostridia bacterium]
MQVAFITGGAGFIGSNFIRFILNKNKELFIVNIDKLTYAGNLKNLESLKDHKSYRFFKEDICNSSGVQELFEKYKPDYVVNFAAESHVDRSIQDSKAFVETNILGTQVLLQAALQHGIKKFVQVSTDEVYGAGDSTAEFTENSPLMPGNPYAASKAAADMLVLAYCHTYGLPGVITRCTNNFGPHQHKEKLIPLVIDKCLRGEKIPVYGDGLQIRDWMYVEDHCSAVLKVLEKGQTGEIYNISADNKMENITLIKEIMKQVSVLLPNDDERKLHINDSLINYIEDRKGHDRGYYINADKLVEQLEWQPAHRFEEAFKHTIKWFVENCD